MSDAIATKQPVSDRIWLKVTYRVLVGVVLVIAVLALLVDVAGMISVWVVRGPAYDNVTEVTASLTQALETINNGLTSTNTKVQDAQQSVTLVNTLATQLGDKIQANNPVVNALSQLVNTNLGPRVDKVRSTTSSIHDAVVTFNGALVTLNRLPNVSTPKLNNALASVSQHAQDAQTAVQDLRTTLAGLKAGVVTKAEAAVTQVTARISAALAQIQAAVSKYQAKVTDTQTQVTSTSNTILTMINVITVALTLLFIIFAAGLVLLVYFCWQYVRNGRFPSLRVTVTP